MTYPMVQNYFPYRQKAKRKGPKSVFASRRDLFYDHLGPIKGARTNAAFHPPEPFQVALGNDRKGAL